MKETRFWTPPHSFSSIENKTRSMSLVFDEYGRPFIILREQQQKARIKGLDAQKANILAARSVSNVLRTSLGPKGLNFILDFATTMLTKHLLSIDTILHSYFDYF